MIGFGRVWRTVVGDEAAGRDAPGSTIPRPAALSRPAPAFEPWGAADDAVGETRASDRFVPHRTATMLTSAQGRRIAGRIINLSRTGVALEAELSGLSPHDITLVGTRPVVPGRRIALGMVFLFRKPLDPKLCGPDIVL